MKIRKRFAAVFSVLFVFVILFTLLATVAMATLEHDYSKPGTSEITDTLDSAEILSALIDKELPSAERAYLEIYGDYEILYSTHIPTSNVKISRDESSGEVSVFASVYTYESECGIPVSFIPHTLTVGSSEYSFSEKSGDTGRYVSEFFVSDYDENQKVGVKYAAEVEISEEDANALLNKAYNDAEYLRELIQSKRTKYESEKKKYDADYKNYQEYLDKLTDYEIARAAYEKYRSEKITYAKKLALYQEFLAEYKIYEDDLAKYKDYLDKLEAYNESYAAYKQYLEIKDKYDELLEKYNAYVRDIAIVENQLAVIDGIKNTSVATLNSKTFERSVYDAVIIGTTVTEVIKNKDAIANSAVGVSPDIVDLAGETTENLRLICKGYFALESEADKYAYYVINYEGFRSNFTQLFAALDKMYTNSKVRLALNEKGIQEKYEILLAQLFYVVNALNDGPVYNYDKTAVYNAKYVINSITKTTPLKILGNIPYIVDNENAVPLDTGYPVKAEKPVYVEPGELLEKPPYMQEPVAPEAVEDPGEEPVAVENPTKPTEVTDPGKAPEPYIPDPVIEEMISARFDTGNIVLRESVSGAQKIKIEAMLEKQLSNVEAYKVEFMDWDENGNSKLILAVDGVDKGTYAEFVGNLPTRPDTESTTYVFTGWREMNSDGTLSDTDYDLTCVESNLVLYPYFTEKTKTYTVTWNINGTNIETEFEYGEMPKCPIEKPTMPDEGNFKFEFLCWDKEILKVTSDITYKAKFKQQSIFVDSSITGSDVKRDENGFYITSTSNDSRFDLTDILSRVTESDSVDIKTKSCALTIQPEAISRMKAVGATKISIDSKLLSGGGGYAMTVNFYDGEGNVISPELARSITEIKISVSKQLDFADSDLVSLYYLENGERIAVRGTYEKGVFTASYVVGRTYYAVVEYSVNVLPSGDAVLSVTPVAKKGERVSVNISELPRGAVVDSLYYITADGITHEITDGGFYMSSGGVSVGIDYHIPTYTVTFIADGKTVYTVVLKYGETVSAPPTPTKASDLQYSYTFVDWQPKPVPVTEDMVYTARYMQVELPKPESNDGVEILPGVNVQIAPSVLSLVAKIVIAAFYAGLVLLPLLIIVIVKGVKRARR